MGDILKKEETRCPLYEHLVSLYEMKFLSLSEHHPWHFHPAFLSLYGAYAMRLAFGVAVVALHCAAGDVDGIDEAIFAQSIGKVPHGLGVSSLDVI